jgi:hypothetical protein
MKSKIINVLFFFVACMNTAHAGISTYQVEYSPANPVAGQAVTFTLLNNDNCYVESIIPSYAENPANLMPFPATYTYAIPGTYFVRFDYVIPPVCLASRENEGKKRSLAPSFFIRPVGQTEFIEATNGAYPLVIRGPAGIPTMSEWAAICLGLVLVIVGVIYQVNERKLLKE